MSSNPKCRKKNCKFNALPDEPYCEVHRFVGTPGTGVAGEGAEEQPIVISGGSVTIKFDDTVLQPLSRGKHSNPDKSLKSITIKGDGIDYSAHFPTGRGVSITIFYHDSNKGKP
ncbi:MAG TPA: hypothetical protein VGB98_26440 [Pyrinomonadaceae bacterium]|jgi:hypothetical protein